MAVPLAVFQTSVLAEFTEYQFRVVPAPPADRYGGWGVAVRTNIKPPANMQATNSTDSAVTIAWTPGSSYSSFYRVVYRVVYTIEADEAGLARRDDSAPLDGATWHVAVNETTETSYAVGDLVPDTSYIFRIFAGNADGTLEGVWFIPHSPYTSFVLWHAAADPNNTNPNLRANGTGRD